MPPEIGVLALQGDFREHVEILRALGQQVREVRRTEQLRTCEALIIPGGESTTIGKLAQAYGLIDAIRSLAEGGRPIWGTCAGMILLARDVGRAQPLVGVMDIAVDRNAFGRQVDSFETNLHIPDLDEVSTEEERARPFRAIFIRAPSIRKVGPGVTELAHLADGTIVAARQANLLVTAFHPELGEDTRFHRYFLRLE